MKPAVLPFSALLLLAGCVQENPGVSPDWSISGDGGVALIVGENYSAGEPIAFQLKTTNYSVVFLNRSGGYSLGSYPSLWICRKTNGSCENVEYREMAGFSRCENGIEQIDVPAESTERKEVYPAESYVLLSLWDQKEWVEERVECGPGFYRDRRAEQVQSGDYTATFVYWVSWDKEPQSVAADFRII
jgi:hypothetical protein